MLTKKLTAKTTIAAAKTQHRVPSGITFARGDIHRVLEQNLAGDETADRNKNQDAGEAVSQFFLQAGGRFGHDHEPDQNERDTEPASRDDRFAQKNPGAERDEDMDGIADRKRDRERKLSDGGEPVKEANDRSENAPPDPARTGVRSGRSTTRRWPDRRFRCAELEKNLGGGGEENADRQLHPGDWQTSAEKKRSHGWCSRGPDDDDDATAF